MKSSKKLTGAEKSAPYQTARWIFTWEQIDATHRKLVGLVCSNCGYVYDRITLKDVFYCPHCGEKMSEYVEYRG